MRVLANLGLFSLYLLLSKIREIIRHCQSVLKSVKKNCYFDGRDRFIFVRKDSFQVHTINDAPLYVLAYILFCKHRCLIINTRLEF